MLKASESGDRGCVHRPPAAKALAVWQARLLYGLGFTQSLKGPPSLFVLLKASEGVGGAGDGRALKRSCRPFSRRSELARWLSNPVGVTKKSYQKVAF